MSADYEYGPLQTFEITWTSGHVERIKAHQVSHRGGDSLFAFGGSGAAGPRRVLLHGEVDGRWTLQLSALEDDIRTIRNVATEDAVADGAS